MNAGYFDTAQKRERTLLGLGKKNQIGEVDFSRYQKVNYGCGYEKLDGYLNVDVDENCTPDLLIPPGDLSSLPKHHFSEVYAKDVLEHIPRGKSLEVLLEFASLLKVGGTLVVQTTSITQVARKLNENPKFSEQFGWTICLFGNQAHPGDFHFTGFTDTTLRVHLKAAGFEIRNESMVEDWMMRFDCVKLESWDDGVALAIDDEGFIRSGYGRFFRRDLDETGRAHFGQRLKAGADRRRVLLDIASSVEHLYVTARRMGLE